jgi:hypothetical protein
VSYIERLLNDAAKLGSVRRLLLLGLVLFTGMFLLNVSVHSGGAPYPESEVITELTWAPVSTIVRIGEGGDNWPTTWGDDGDLYTAYGDGWGFEPKVPTKLGLGFGKVKGEATDFVGSNIRSAGEQIGDGKRSKKASGLLMVEGILYMWVRNADRKGQECQLAWSQDHGQSWQWSTWTFPQFGYCTFINFGQNYAGARDNYVYTVSHDHPNAYTAADHFILMRVPKDQIDDRTAYEFFVQLDSSGTPLWTSDVSQREGVFHHPNRAWRSGISYNAALGRYLWWQQIPDFTLDAREEGGFGVYDAAEPWGPWTTVYYTENWDVGPGETAHFPPKWMSADGKTLHLVFSGDDAFSVRQATLTTVPDELTPTPTETPGGTIPQPTPKASSFLFLPTIEVD